jgi:Secretion system C-terminal sorting domain
MRPYIHLNLNCLIASMVVCLVLAKSNLAYAQSAAEESLEREEIQDPYLANAYGNQKVTPAYQYTQASKTSNTSITTVQVNVNAGNQNIVGDAANEPNIAINPLHPNEMVIGWRQFDNIASNFRQAGYGYSTDAGQTWTFPGVLQPGGFRSDPVLDHDNGGQILYNSLKADNVADLYCDLFRSTDGGGTWGNPTYMRGGDKSWMAVDRTGGVGEGNIYAAWSDGGTGCAQGSMSRSVDGGQSFQYCYVLSAQLIAPVMTVNNEGKLLVVGATPGLASIIAVHSPNANQPSTTMAWYAPVEVYMRGSMGFGMPVNPVGILGQLNLDVDRSHGPGRGTAYLMATVKRAGINGEYSDAMIVHSTDNGFTWSSPTMINDDAPGVNASQWFGTMSIAPDGRIDVVWLDTRDGGANPIVSALYYSYSIDQGNTWSPNEKLSDTFDPSVGYPNQNKLGDYFDMISDDTGAHLAWANTLNGGHDVYYSHIVPGTNVAVDASAQAASIKIFPNPTADIVIVSGCPPGRETSVTVRNLLGVQVAAALARGGQVEVDLRAQPAGVYLVEMQLPNGRREVQKVVRQ